MVAAAIVRYPPDPSLRFEPGLVGWPDGGKLTALLLSCTALAGAGPRRLRRRAAHCIGGCGRRRRDPCSPCSSGWRWVSWSSSLRGAGPGRAARAVPASHRGRGRGPGRHRRCDCHPRAARAGAAGADRASHAAPVIVGRRRRPPRLAVPCRVGAGLRMGRVHVPPGAARAIPVPQSHRGDAAVPAQCVPADGRDAVPDRALSRLRRAGQAHPSPVRRVHRAGRLRDGAFGLDAGRPAGGGDPGRRSALQLGAVPSRTTTSRPRSSPCWRPRPSTSGGGRTPPHRCAWRRSSRAPACPCVTRRAWSRRRWPASSGSAVRGAPGARSWPRR